MIKKSESPVPSFWHWYWIDTERLKNIMLLLLLLSPVLVGISLDIIFHTSGPYFPKYASIGGVILAVFLCIFSAWDYIDTKKIEYETFLGRIP